MVADGAVPALPTTSSPAPARHRPGFRLSLLRPLAMTPASSVLAWRIQRWRPVCLLAVAMQPAHLGPMVSRPAPSALAAKDGGRLMTVDHALDGDQWATGSAHLSVFNQRRHPPMRYSIGTGGRRLCQNSPRPKLYLSLNNKEAIGISLIKKELHPSGHPIRLPPRQPS